MTLHAALAVLSLAAAQPAATPHAGEERRLVIAEDTGESTSARLVETAEAVRFEISGPVFTVPSIAIDARRNGRIDPDEDFMVSSAPDGSPCLTQLLAEGQSTPCGPLGAKAELTRTVRGDVAVTTFTFRKQVISTDGFGFGFAISLYNAKGRYGASLGGGDYRFGGFLSLTQDGPNFTGGGIGVPAEVLPAVRRYQACLNRSTDALAPLEPSKLAKLRAVPARCSDDRRAAFEQGVNALVTAGADQDLASSTMTRLIDRLDVAFNRLVKALEIRAPGKHPN